MKFNEANVRKCLKSFDFPTLFREHLGWDKHQATLEIPIDGTTIELTAVAQKRGFIAYTCPSIPDRATRLKIDHQVTKSAREHFVIYADQDAGQQVWQWIRREPGKPIASRDHRFDVSTPGYALIQRLDLIAVSIEEEETFTLTNATDNVRKAFDVDKVTKKFYERFKAEHAAFLKFIKGIKNQGDLQWYTSLMLNRLMFVYFIQKKGFLDGDTNYLQNRMQQVQQLRGKDKFQSFYSYFLVRLFHDGLGKHKDDRKLDRDLEKLLGKVPYLNGGFFEVHQLEQRYQEIEIPDQAFEKLFAFFDEFSWHLDERPLRAGNEINPDVVGYIFEKYINQKQMGAYYTKEDITEYISKNTIIPYLFDAAQKKCPIAFKPDSFLWRLLRDDPDRYIYPAVRLGVIDDAGNVIPLPKSIEAGIKKIEKRDGWNRPADEPFALPTETWREHVARRQRCLELREQLAAGKVHEINDLITLNLDIWQFARDSIVNSEGPELLRAFWHAIAGRVPTKSTEKLEAGITVLDPTCGSGAFLFAALRILETLYSDCLERMERFVEDQPDSSGKRSAPFADFKRILAQMAEHANERYFILKSIVINNLFGVDIMEEAIEICKLRLFLKLVAQVESADQIEPLPDIDFNIRAGNTLVGYVSLDEIKQSQKGKLGYEAEEIARIEEDVLAVEKSFAQFRLQQTALGGKVTAADKQELRDRLAKLDDQLDRYLAGEYGIDPDGKKQGAFEEWKKSHQPFHWFVEFYGIMAAGGFDVIIGNPPYLDLKGFSSYALKSYSTIPTKNLYPLILERSWSIAANGRQGFIVPVSSVATQGYLTLQRLLVSHGLVISSYDDRPSHLFDGLDKNTLSILLAMPADGRSRITHSTRLCRWNAEERPALFQSLQYVPTPACKLQGCIPKIGSPIEHDIWDLLYSSSGVISDFYAAHKRHCIYYSRKVNAFMQILDFVPEVRDGKGCLRPPSEFKPLFFDSAEEAAAVVCLFNSSLFRWFMDVVSDGSHLNRREIDNFPFVPEEAASRFTRFPALAKRLSDNLKKTSETRVMRYKHDTLTVQCIIAKHSKAVINDIERELANYYTFNPEQCDFLINYDIKYRIGIDGNH